MSIVDSRAIVDGWTGYCSSRVYEALFRLRVDGWYPWCAARAMFMQKGLNLPFVCSSFLKSLLYMFLGFVSSLT